MFSNLDLSLNPEHSTKFKQLVFIKAYMVSLLCWITQHSPHRWHHYCVYYYFWGYNCQKIRFQPFTEALNTVYEVKKFGKDVITYKCIKCLGIKSSTNKAAETTILTYCSFQNDLNISNRQINNYPQLNYSRISKSKSNYLVMRPKPVREIYGFSRFVCVIMLQL